MDLFKRYLIAISLLFFCAPFLYAKPPHTFQEAKKRMYEIYADHRQSIYCQCHFDSKRMTDFESCGYHIRKDPNRAAHMEAEHIVPAWVFGHKLACWSQKRCTDPHGKKYGGRKCCRKIDPYFREMENDLYNLAPAVGEVNADRQDYPFTDWHGAATEYGQCEIVIDFHNKRVQPPHYARGFIARTYQYMIGKYHIELTDDERKHITQWAKEFPESSWEQLRRQRIEIILNS